MANLIEFVQGATHGGLLHQLRDSVDHAAAAIAERRRRARVMRELAACDERELHDIGLTRGDFEAVARGSYRR